MDRRQSEDLDASLGKPSVTLTIMFDPRVIGVDLPVHFHSEVSFGAEEVEDVISNRVLPAEFQACCAPPFELFPEQTFR